MSWWYLKYQNVNEEKKVCDREYKSVNVKNIGCMSKHQVLVLKMSCLMLRHL